MTCVQIELFFFDCLVLAFTLSHLRSVLSLDEQVFSAGDTYSIKVNVTEFAFYVDTKKKVFVEP